jgi:hypothetical protein
LDDFEDGDVSEWSTQTDWSASTTTAFEGSYAGHLTGDPLPTLSFSAISPSEYLFAQRHDTTTGRPGQRIFSGANVPIIIQVDDGSTITAGNVAVYNGSWVDTGISVSTQTWYLYRIAPDFANDQFGLTVEDASQNVIGSDSNLAFNASASDFDKVEARGEDAATDCYQDYLGYN